MRRRAFIQTSMGLGLVGTLSADAAENLQWQTTTFHGLGTTLSIRAAHTDASKLKAALAAARAVVAHVEDHMSLFRPTSAISRLNREGELLNPHPDLLRVLNISQRIAMQSQGAFDVTVQPLWRMYATAQMQGRLPTTAEIENARQHVGWQHLHFDAQRIAFAKPAMGITLNGIAQGYASDRVREELERHGVAHALINTGEWSALGQAPSGRDWVLGIADPRQSQRLITRLRMRGGCVATSADDQCSFTDDHAHHHILNPETGYSPRDIASVTVVAKTCTEADALTKVLFVAGYERALHIASQRHVDALVVHKDGRWKASPALQFNVVA
jgi:thiamine biosynthesis lipoprotein